MLKGRENEPIVDYGTPGTQPGEWEEKENVKFIINHVHH